MKELDLKLTLGMAERQKLSLHLMRNRGEGVSGSNLGQTQKSPSLGVWLFLVQSVTIAVESRAELINFRNLMTGKITKPPPPGAV